MVAFVIGFLICALFIVAIVAFQLGQMRGVIDVAKQAVKETQDKQRAQKQANQKLSQWGNDYLEGAD